VGHSVVVNTGLRVEARLKASAGLHDATVGVGENCPAPLARIHRRGA
jgi:hypothetical protein